MSREHSTSLDNEALRAEQSLGGEANRLQKLLAAGLRLPDADGPSRLTSSRFYDIYDPDLPTIAIDVQHTFPGAEYLGYAGVRSPQPERLNVVYFGGTDYGLIHDADKTKIGRGMLTDVDGSIVYGEFPEPVSVALIETSDSNLLRRCAEVGIDTVTSYETYLATSDKKRLHEVLGDTAIGLPERYDNTMLGTIGAPVVIKPSLEAQGKGVYIAEDDSKHKRLSSVYDFLSRYGYEPIIERRIRSTPLRDPETGKRLDWNVRAILAEGALIDMYIRADEWGKPINKTRGSKVITKRRLAEYLEQPAEADTLLAKLEHGATRVGATLGRGMFGLDMTVDESGEAFIYEANSGNFGGLQTLAAHEGGTTWLRNADKIIDGLVRRIDAKTGKSKDTRTITNDVIRINGMPTGVVADKPADEEGKRTFVRTTARFTDLYTEYSMLRIQPDQKTLLPELADIEQRLRAEFPLELRSYLPEMLTVTEDPESFRSFAEQMSWLYPGETEWQISRGVIAARTLDGEKLRSIVRALPDEMYGDTKAETVLAVLLYEQCLYPILDSHFDAISQETMDVMQSASEVSLLEGYEKGSEVLDACLTELEPGDELLALHHYACMLSVAFERPEAALEHLRTVRKLEPAMLVFDVVPLGEGIESFSTRNMEGLVLRNLLHAEAGYNTFNLFELLDSPAKPYAQLDPEQHVRLARQMAELLPIAQTDEDRERVTATISKITETIGTGRVYDYDAAESVPPPDTLAGNYCRMIARVAAGMNDDETFRLIGIFQQIEAWLKIWNAFPR